MAACSQDRSASAGAESAASVNRLRSDVTFLASDDLEGRGTPSRGLDLAALELARQVARAPGRRSLLVLLVSGEECGPLGSAYYAAHPVAPMKQVVAQINLDMVGRPEGNKVEALAHV